MKRKKSTVPSRVWTYGCLYPTAQAEEIFRQLRCASLYYNKLIEIERERRERYRKARTEIGAVLATLEATRDAITKLVDEHRDKLKGERAQARKRLPSADMRGVIKIELQRRREVVDKIRVERERLSHDPRLVAESEEINAWATRRIKEERAKCGMYWGSYILVERAVEAARKSKLDPRFHRFDGKGRIGVQVQGGIDRARLFGGADTRVQLSSLPDTQWDTRSGRRHAYSTLKLRVGSDNGKPVWAEVPALLHRPLPKDAKIMWAWIKVNRIGPRTKFELQITMESEDFRRDPPLVGSERVAALDIGWRALKSGDLRVAYLYDYMGNRKQFALPKAVRESLAKSDSLRAINDRLFNTARLVLKAWLAEHPTLAPEWMAEEVETMHAWRSRGRLARLADRWAKELPDGYVQKAWQTWKDMRLGAKPKLDLLDEAKVIFDWVGGTPLQQIVCYLEFWRRKELHLWSWEANEREGAHLRRKDIYRNWAAELKRNYAFVAIEDFDLSKVARIENPEDDQEQVSVMRRVRSDAAPNELRLALLSAFGPACLPRVDPKNTTRTHDCGHVNTGDHFKLDIAADITVTCQGCGQEFDQDEQAAKNIFRAHESSRAGGDDGGPKKKVRRKVSVESAAPPPAE